jgi:hypothetical protein
LTEKTEKMEKDLINESNRNTQPLSRGKLVDTYSFVSGFLSSNSGIINKFGWCTFFGLGTAELISQQLLKSSDPKITSLAFTPPSQILNQGADSVVSFTMNLGSNLATCWNFVIEIMRKIDLSIIIDPFFNIGSPIIRILGLPLYLFKGFANKLSSYNYPPHLVIGTTLFFAGSLFAWELLGVTKKNNYKPSNAINFLNKKIVTPLGLFIGHVIARISSYPIELFKLLKLENWVVATNNLIGSFINLITTIPRSAFDAYKASVNYYSYTKYRSLIFTCTLLLLVRSAVYLKRIILRQN